MNQVSNKTDSRFVFSKTLKMILANNRSTVPVVEEVVTLESIHDDLDCNDNRKLHSGEELHESFTT